MDDNQTAETIHDAGKLSIAEAARLMGDNQRTLDRTNDQDARARDRHERIEDAKAKAQYADLADPAQRSGEDMEINVDSPTTTVTHNYPSPQSVLTQAAPYLLAAAAGAVAVGLVALLVSVLEPAEPGPDSDTQYILELVPDA
jgi:hypothetical protein